MSYRLSMAYLGSVLLCFLAASSAPTPLYPLYQQAWGFSPAVLTLVFAVYAFSLLLALLTVGKLSDHLGRRPVIAVALMLELLAMGVFLEAPNVPWLIAARVLQGFATGMATSVLGAALVDRDAAAGPLLNSLTPMFGMAAGALGCSLLVEYGPWPLRLVYAVLGSIFFLQVLLLAWLPESVSRAPGALASLKPAVQVPVQARAALWRALPVDVACWALGGFFLSLAPLLVRGTTGLHSPLLPGALVATLTLAGAAAIYTLRNRPATGVLRLGTGLLASGLVLLLLAVHSGMAALFFFATLVAGAGFGSGFLGAVRSVIPLAHAHERAALMAAFYVLSYLAFCVPALVAGLLVKALGLVATADAYATTLLLLCILSGLAMRRTPQDARTHA
ncbi:Predicted arabinose efflux permease, MFS family [Pseudomonas sp. URIL14HWK12:I9]|nr:putative MFS family arabinose efflux permease [Pseudomonas sp. URIL14HWK12:I12]PVZ27552.1 putative MFS family arabinose efflux permease [Pseudomonas sp. URIL14HWK12:I10]PVZ38441.1 putative MFS family arabinose efflux permease [Pseudomonas sp. URIL14HWK12:I11]SNZ03344.1 Predicted arabinose efflux permease, MFS family [Pseudomonas sp. URIL14HWK12:I9]